MLAVLCKVHGGPESLVIEHIDPPTPAAGEAIVDIAYVGLNFHDTLLMAGKHVVQPALPFSPGSEYAGVVSAVGEGVTSVKVGDRVAGNCEYGAAREQLAVPAERLIVLPEGVSERLGATMLVTYSTSLHALKQCGRLESGETLAVLGASGGVGLAAVEIGHAMGARVIACASSADRIAFTLEHGASDGIDYGSADLKSELKRLTQGAGVDVIYDPVGGRYSEAALRALAWRGRHLVVGFAAGEIPRIPLNLPLVKACTIVGVFFGEFARREPRVHRENVAQLFEWARTGRLSPHVHDEFPMRAAASAWEVLARREARGKVLLSIR